jgi:hypothetical protein
VSSSITASTRRYSPTIQNIIKSEYDLAADLKKDQLAMAVYSLLASNIGQRALVHQDWFKQKKENFAKYSLNYIDVADLKAQAQQNY